MIEKNGKKVIPGIWDYANEDDPIYMPDIRLDELKRFSGSYMVGGGKNECLAEVKLLMNAFNIKYKLVKKFVY